MYPNNQKIKARLVLLDIAPHRAVKGGSYNIYTLTGVSELGQPYSYDVTFISPVKLDISELVDSDVDIFLEDEKDSFEHKEIC